MVGSVILDRPVDLTRLPVTFSMTEDHHAGAMLAAAAGFWIGVVVLFGGRELAGDRDLAQTWPFLLFLLLGVVFLFWGVALFWRRITVTLQRDEVLICWRGLLGTRQQRLPLSAYRGLMRRTMRISSGESPALTGVGQVLLWHDDPDLSVVLFASRDLLEVRRYWLYAGLWLPMPLLEEVAADAGASFDSPPNEPTVEFDAPYHPPAWLTGRPSADAVAKALPPPPPPMAGFAACSPADATWPDPRPLADLLPHPPPEVAVRQEGNDLYLAFTPRYFSTRLWGVTLSVPLGLLGLGLLFPGASPLAAVGGALAAAATTVHLWTRVTTELVEIGREQLAVESINRWGVFGQRKRQLVEIERTALRADPINRLQLILESPTRPLKMGAGLPEPALLWLAETIAAAANRRP